MIDASAVCRVRRDLGGRVGSAAGKGADAVVGCEAVRWRERRRLSGRDAQAGRCHRSGVGGVWGGVEFFDQGTGVGYGVEVLGTHGQLA